MKNVAIDVQNVSKIYRVGSRQTTSLREKIAHAFSHTATRVSDLVRGNNDGQHDQQYIWALKDVTFEIEQGSVLGIIGSNGAGKTTLLKILSRITEPTEGFIEIRGQIASLLEVGTGFHPELTGRENIYLNGVILGMKKNVIDSRFDEIVSFAEIEKFIDTPVKHYSSGMYIRLAFSVAAHLDPEILIVDEVLAVGDAAFQRKCLGRMENAAQGGRTILFVSHNLSAVTLLTKKCLYLKQGQIEAFGNTQEIVQKYYHDSLVQMGANESSLDFYRRSFRADWIVRVETLSIKDGLNAESLIPMGADFKIEIGIESKIEIREALVSVVIKTADGKRVALFFSWDQNFHVDLDPGKNVIELLVRGLPLSPGQYLVDAGVNQSTLTTSYDLIVDFPLFHVAKQTESDLWPDRPWGAIHWTKVEWSNHKEK
jgi:lipopolysaccharide transport system ATP-binding protein